MALLPTGRFKFGAGNPKYLTVLNPASGHGQALWLSQLLGQGAQSLAEFVAKVAVQCGSGNTRTSYANDPNAKTGPAGFGTNGFIAASGALAYRVGFENETNASAPAQQVVITDQLSGHLDWSTFQLTEVGFGDQLIVVPPNSQHFETNVPVNYLGTNSQVQIEAGIRLDSGQAYAIFRSIDPATSLPPPVHIGFLPPEDGTGRGMGHIAYTINAKPNLPTGTQIRNVALISFDLLPLIATNQKDPHNPGAGADPAKECLNTIDAGEPTSRVLPPPATTNRSTFLVEWPGEDEAGGSGVAGYDVYFSDNGGAWTLWQTNSTNTAAVFPGQCAHTYAFYSVARDNVGHVEAPPASPDATIEVACYALADLTLAVDSAGVARVGSNLTQIVYVENNGPGVAAGVVLSNLLPAGMTLVSSTASQGSCVRTGNVVRCNLGSLASGSRATVMFVFTKTTAGSLKHVFSVKANEADPDVTNNALECTSAFVLPPQITGVVPGSGPVGSVVTISGSGFAGVTGVRFNGVSATFSVGSRTSIKAVVPVGATPGPVTVTTLAGATSGAKTFSVVATNVSTAISFSPTNGPVGASVTITGPGLTNATAVRFNTGVATFTRAGADTLRAVVPADATPGPIVVTKPGMVFVSTNHFTVLPAITTFTPASSSAAGSTVTLTGSGFAGATAVRFNGVGARFTVVSPTSIRALLPASATTGPITVTTPAGTAQSSNVFRVLPGIRAFTPASSPVGGWVAILGNGFSGATNVLFNGVSAEFTVIGADAIVATVPTNATTGPVQVRAAAGMTTSTTPFRILPAITSLSPTNGTAGTTVWIQGSAFKGATAVRFGGVSATFTVVTNHLIRAVVPSAVTNALIYVTTPSGSATSAVPFIVWPQVSGFQPAQATVGTKVTVKGSGLAGTTNVQFNGVNASFTKVTANGLEAVVPTNASSGPIRVSTPAGVATSAGRFNVLPRIASFAPTNGPVGTVVTISGTGFSGVTSVQFGDVSASGFTVVSPTVLRATVPAAATNGPVRVKTAAGTVASAEVFVVVPTIRSFTPTNGGFGATVTIAGTGFAGVTNVQFNGVDAGFSRVSPASIRATVPTNATTGPIRVWAGGTNAVSTNVFVVTVPRAPADLLELPGIDQPGTMAERPETGAFAVSLAIRRLDNVGVVLRVVSPPGSACAIEASTDLVAWKRLTVLTNATGTVEFVDQDATALPHRFYRAVRQ